MKYFYTLLVVIGCSTMGFSQAKEECFVLNKENITIPQEFSKIQRATNGTDYEKITFKIFFWGFKLSDNSGNVAFTEENIENTVGWLNEIYNQANIFFELSGYETILSNEYYKLDGPFEFDNMLLVLRAAGLERTDAFNIYVSNEYSQFGGIAEAYSKTTVGIPAVQLVNSGTMQHEIGHCFSLFHTNDAILNQIECESATRNPSNPYFNADITGDLVVDTAACFRFDATDIDPENCTVTVFNRNDCFGYPYTIPSSILRNHMTIKASVCEKDRFTDGQFLRIRQAIKLDRYGLFEQAAVD